MDHLKLTTDKLSVEAISDLVVDDSCGAVSMFVGTTRDNFDGKTVLRLEYEAYEPMALKAMKGICDDIRNKWPTVHSIAMYHRLGMVPTREASVVIAVSSPHRQESLSAVAHCLEALKGSVPIWKKEIYDKEDPVWKENAECSSGATIDKSLVQITVSCDELQRRIQNFIERKREQVNVSNVHDFFTPSKTDAGADEEESCARVRTTFVRRNDSKGHLKIRKVNNEWGPQTARQRVKSETIDNQQAGHGLPIGIAERVGAIEKFLNISPVDKDVYRRLKEMEDRIADLEAVSPEYAQFWRRSGDTFNSDLKQDHAMEVTFTADDISKKIEQLEREGNI